MRFFKKERSLIGREGNEKIQVEAWGHNALRVRATKYPEFSGKNHALDYVEPGDCQIRRDEQKAEIQNGKIRCVIDCRGFMEFYSGEKLILKEYYRSFSGANAHSPSMKIIDRDHKSKTGGD